MTQPSRGTLGYVAFALIVAAPTAVSTWIITRGLTPRPEPCPVCPAQAPASSAAPRPGASAEAPSTPSGEGGSATVQNAGDTPEAVVWLKTPLSGARPKGEIETYGAKGLFAYINGGAPAYLERNFQQLVAAELKHDNGGELTCDIYDMGTPEHAKAIFEHEAQPTATALDLGDAARKSNMALVFRSTHYYVKLTAFDAKAESELGAIAKMLLERMR